PLPLARTRLTTRTRWIRAVEPQWVLQIGSHLILSIAVSNMKDTYRLLPSDARRMRLQPVARNYFRCFPHPTAAAVSGCCVRDKSNETPSAANQNAVRIAVGFQ